MSLGSKSTYFHQPAQHLSLDKQRMHTILEMRGFTAVQIEHFCKAFDYFTQNPSRYDGATASQDLCDVKGLEFAGMLHDWMYIALKAHLKVSTMRKADSVMKAVMRKMCKSGAEITWRMWRLAIIRRPFAIYNQFLHGFQTEPLTGYITKIETQFKE